MIYAYIRVSTDKQTVENQRFEINRFAKQRDFQIDVWVEETVSGTRSAKDRKLGVLLKRIKKGDTLIVSEISRLGRRLMEVMSILNACCLLYTSDAADEEDSVDLGGRRILNNKKKKKKLEKKKHNTQQKQ